MKRIAFRKLKIENKKLKINYITDKLKFEDEIVLNRCRERPMLSFRIITTFFRNGTLAVPYDIIHQFVR